MKEEILLHLREPAQLEKLYRSNKPAFKQGFEALYPELKGQPLADFWHERLYFQTEAVNWGSKRELLFVVVASFLAGVVAKLPELFSISEEFFYPRNIGFIVFPALMAYFFWKTRASAKKIAGIAAGVVAGLLFINSLPDVETSDTLILSCLHLLLVLWVLLGLAFMDRDRLENRLAFLRYNGELIVMTTLLLIGGALLSGLSIGLFSLIGFQIDDFYFRYIGVFGLAAAPLVGTYLTQTNPQLVGKVSPVIARIFSPLVLVMLILYLGAIFYSGKSPYNDRDFLMIFNALLIGVLALLFFSVAEHSRVARKRSEIWVLFFLSLASVLVTGIALSAILFRIWEWGITPNRAAVLGGNALILIHLLMLSWQFFRAISKRTHLRGVANAIGRYIPVYFLWTLIVTFLFPLIFGFE